MLAAISLAPSASAAPYTTSSSVDSFDSYSNSTTVAQDPSSSSVPSMLYPYGRTITLSRPTSPLDVRRDEVIRIESLYDGSPFGSVFGPVAQLFGSMGIDTVSQSTPHTLTEAQKAVVDQLQAAIGNAADTVIAHLPINLPLPLPPRSLEDRQLMGPLAVFEGLPVGDALSPLADLLSSVGLVSNSPAPMTDLQKQVIAKLAPAISNAVGTITANIPVKLGVLPLPLGHQSNSVEERSLEDIVSVVDNAPVLGSLLAPVTTLIKSIGITNGAPMNDAQKLVLSKVQDAIAEVVKNLESHVPSVHIEHAREEPERLAQDYRDDPHRDDHHSLDAHKDDRKDGHKSQDDREDVHKSPDVRKEDHDAQRMDRGGNRCREPRDGQRDEWERWDDWRHHNDGKDRNEGSSLLEVNLGHSCRP